MYNDINCPYCNEPQDIDHDDGYGYDEDELHQQECGKCEKTFVFTTSISFHYTPEKADCLNEGGQHEYKLTNTLPRCLSKMRCSTCNDERSLTEKERIEFKIQTKEEYLESLKEMKSK